MRRELSNCAVSCRGLGTELSGECSHRVAVGPKMVIASYGPLFEVIQMCLAGLLDAGSMGQNVNQHSGATLCLAL